MIQAKLIVYAVTALSIFAGGYWLYNQVWDKGYSQHKLEVAADSAKVHAAHAAELILKGIEHDKNTATITRLSNELGRLRIFKPRSPCPKPEGTPADTSGAGGVLPVDVDTAYQRFEQGLRRLAFRCDQLNNAAIRSNE